MHLRQTADCNPASYVCTNSLALSKLRIAMIRGCVCLIKCVYSYIHKLSISSAEVAVLIHVCTNIIL